MKSKEEVALGMGALGYMPPDRITEPNSCSLAPLGFREAVCRAAAWDAGNRHMSKANRVTWNEEDYNAASREYERLYISK